MSTVPEVLAALAAVGVATLTGSPTPQVINGDITTVTTTMSRLFLVGDEEFEIEAEFDSLGGVTTTEHYVVPCSIRADLPTPDQSVADAQAWADFEAIQAAVANDPSLGLSGTYSLRAAIVGIRRFRRTGTSNVRSAVVKVGIDVFAAQS